MGMCKATIRLGSGRVALAWDGSEVLRQGCVGEEGRRSWGQWVRGELLVGCEVIGVAVAGQGLGVI